MSRSRAQKWVALLEPIVAEAVATAGGGSAGALAAAIYARTPDLPARPTDPRPEIDALYAYAARLCCPAEAIDRLNGWIGSDEPDSATLPADAQPESWWYGRLVRLHALTSRAILTGDPRHLRQSGDLARYVHAEIQPDHATGLPWAIHAFVLAGDECETTAEWVLNACMIQTGGTPTGAALVLLAETLYGLRHVVATAHE